MKTIILIASGLVISSTGLAQLSLGVQGTSSVGTAKFSNNNNASYNKKLLPLAGAGIVIQYDLNDKLALRSGINYQQQGVTVNYNTVIVGNQKGKAENQFQYIQVPVTLLYKIPLSNIQLYAGLGGYVGYAVSGTSKTKFAILLPNGSEVITEEKINAFKKESENGAGFKRLDLGAAALAGIKLKNGLFANLGYQFGLADIDSNKDATYYNRSLQLSVGYILAL